MENEDEKKLRLKVQELLGKEITQFILKGKGDYNYAYYVETQDGGKYIVKREREDKNSSDQNNGLVVEGNLLRKLYNTNLSIPIPRVVFVEENPKLYGYEYMEGDLMRDAWSALSETERIDICQALGCFHAEIGKKFTKEMSKEAGIKINESKDIHPESISDCSKVLTDSEVPEEFKTLVKEARVIFDGVMYTPVFQFIHNDSHLENILIKDKKISGIIDYGDSEYGEVTKEFSRYIRDFPDYFKHIVSSYEKESGNKLSYKRLVSYAFLSGIIDIVKKYKKGGKDREEAEEAISIYRKLIEEIKK